MLTLNYIANTYNKLNPLRVSSIMAPLTYSFLVAGTMVMYETTSFGMTCV